MLFSRRSSHAVRWLGSRIIAASFCVAAAGLSSVVIAEAPGIPWLTGAMHFGADEKNTGNLAPPPSQTFVAVDPANSTPPDSHGAVGPNHILTQTNGSSRVFDRSGNLLGSMGIKNFWSGLGVSDVFDPKVVFDPHNNRFIAVACAQRRSSASGMLFGVSDSDDPTGDWHLWLLDADGSNNDWVDFPNLGLTANRITFTGNLFTIADDSFTGVNIWVVNTASAMDGGSLNFELLRVTNAGGTLVPPVTYDASITTQYIVRTGTANIFGSGRLQLYNITGNIGSLSFNTNPSSTVGAAWSISVPNAKQKGTSALIETNDSRLMDAVIRNGSLWTVHTVALSTTVRDHAAVKWWQVDPFTSSSLGDGAIEDVDGAGNFDTATGRHYYFPSVAVNKNDEVVIGFSGSSGQDFVSNFYTYREPSYPAGQFDIPRLFHAGVGTYSGPRWGDYSSAVVDPVDDATLWTIQQYAAGGNKGGNAWAQIGQAVGDSTAPTVSGASATNETTVRVTFSESMTDNAALVDTGAYLLDGGLTVSDVTRVNASQVDLSVSEMNNGTGYTVTVSTSGPTDTAGNTVSGSANTAGFTGIGTGPVATITLLSDNPTNANSVQFSVIFDEPVGSTFTAADVTVTGSLASGASVNVSGTDPSYIVEVTPSSPSAEGALAISIGTGVTDSAGNTSSGASSPASFVVDNTAPSVGVATLLTNDTTPALSGTTNDSTASISISVGGQTRSATNNGNGTWTLPNNTLSPLADGTYNVIATATDPAGNSGTDGTNNELTIDATVPVITVNTLTTNDKTPPLTGTVNEANATISVMVGGQTRSATNNGNGTWTLPDGSLSALSDGTYNVTATAVDPIGNTGTDNTSNELVVDTTAPVVTVNPVTTNDTRPPLSGGVSDLTAPVTVVVGGQTRSATNNGDGTWTLADNAISPALSAGTYNVVASATDAANNTGTDSTSNELMIDVTAPTVTVNSRTTNDLTPQLTGTVNDAGASLSVSVGGQTRAATNNGNGTWTLSNNSLNPLTPGTYNVAVTATDTAGNAGTDSTNNELVIDTTAPTITVNALSNPTNDPTPPLSGTVNDANATISISVGGQTRTATNNGSTWSLANGALNPLPDNTYNVVATATDVAGNTGTDGTSGELTVDTTAPTVAIDNLSTSDSTPPLTGTVSETSATIMITVSGQNRTATNNGDGTWSLANNSLNALPDGTYNVHVTATDSAGNSGSDGTSNELVIDGTAPVVAVNTLTTNDNRPQLTGTVNDVAASISISVGGQTRAATNNGNGTWTLTDNAISPALGDGTYNVGATATDSVGNAGTDGTSNELTIDTATPSIGVNTKTTNDTTPSLTGTVDDPSATVTISVSGQNRTATNNGNGTWTLADGSLNALAENTYNVAATATDAAGNAGTDSTSGELVIDTTAPAITVTAKVTNDTTPSLAGTVNDSSATISIMVSGQTRAAANNGDGTWTLADGSLSALGEGVFSVTARATDAAGNVGTDGTSNELTVDSVTPMVTVNSLTTTDTTPTLTGNVSESGASVSVSVGGQNNLSATNNGNGTWTLPGNTLSALSGGTYDVAVTATDAAGNTGSDGSSNELTIDTAAPVVTVNTLSTNDARPQLSGTVDDLSATLSVSVGGQTGLAATNNGNGTWTLPDNTINPGLATGTYDVEVSATDPLGNVGNDATTNELTVDTTAPVVGIDPLLTNDQRPPLTGTVDDPLAAIAVSVGGQNRTATNNGDGTWTLANNAINPNLAPGTYNVAATATDPAGNSATDTTNAELTIDTTPPAVTVNALETNDNRPALAGTVDDTGATISVTVNGQANAATNNGNGTWSLADNTLSALSDATYDVSVTATDAAGNTGSDGTANELTIDTMAPVVTVDTLVTADQRPELTGGVDDTTATVSILVNGQLNSATNNGDGSWTLPDNTLTALPGGTYNVTASATDTAGNTGSDGSVNELTIDLVAPVVTVDSLTTNDTTPELTGNVNDAAATISVTVGGNTYPATNNGATWTLPDNTISPALGNGTFNVSVTATDSAGNAGSDGTNNELTIDLTAPAVTVNSLTTSDNTPALNGTVDDNSATISVAVGGQNHTATNNGNGTWTLANNTISPGLSDGTYDVSVTATDTFGNVGNDGTTDELVVDGSVPVVTIDALVTSDTRPELTGTVDPSSATNIRVDVGGQTNLPATNNGDGTWTLADDTINPGLADGVYDVAVRATTSGTGTDSTANELVIDTTAPVVAVDALETNDGRPPLSGTVDDPDASILVDVGGQTNLPAANNGDGTWTLPDNTINPALAPATYDVSVTATDVAGNVGTDGSANELVIDQTAPVVTVDSPQQTNDSTPPVTGTVDDINATVLVSVNGQSGLMATVNGGGVWTLADNSINPLADGTYDVSAQATDPAGNTGSDGSSDELTVDTTPPGVTVMSSETADNTPELNGTVTEASATVSVMVGGQTNAATNNGDMTWTLADDTLTTLGDNVYDVKVTVTDTFGNSAMDNTTGELRVDTTAPMVTVNTLLTSDTRPQLTGTVNDIGASVVIDVGGQAGLNATNNGNGTWTLADDVISPGLADGTYDVMAMATDSLGNSASDGTSNELTIDTAPPVVTVDALTTNDTQPELTGTIDDATSTIVVAVAGNSYEATNNGDMTWTLADNTITPALAQGTYSVQATATNDANVVGTDATNNELTIDVTAPGVSINTLYTQDTTPMLTGTVNDPAATIAVGVDGQNHAATNNGDGTWTLADNTISPALAENTYSVTVTATDAANNVGTDGTSNELHVDLTPPVVMVNFLSTADNTPGVSGSVTDNDSPGLTTVSVTIDGQTNPTFRLGNSWFVLNGALTPLADGTYDVQATATDAANNVGSDGSNNELVVDTTAPVVTLDLLQTNDITPELSGTVDDPTATISVSVASQAGVAATNNGDGTWTLADDTLSALPDGTYDVTVMATDTLGNAGADGTTDELLVDATAPAVTVSALLTNDSTPALSGTVDDPAATILVDVGGQTDLPATNNGDGTWTLADNTVSALAEGTYDVAATATDSFSNAGADSTANELEVDLTAPAITVESFATNDVTPPLNGTVDDPAATILVDVGGQTGVAATNLGTGIWTVPNGTLSELADGVYDVVARATDPAGNEGADGSVNELTINTNAPSVTVDSLSTADTTPPLSGTVDDSGASITVTVASQVNTATNNGDGTWTLADNVLAALSDGVYNVVVAARDAQDNVGNDSTQDELEIDTQGPVVTIDNLLTNDTTPPLSGTVDDPAASIMVTVDGQVNAATNNGDGTWTLADNTLSPLGDNAAGYDVAVSAADPLGNTGNDSTTNELRIDTVAPVVTVNSLTTSEASPQLTGSVDDTMATVSVTVNGETAAATNNSNGTWTLVGGTLSALNSGVYDVAAVAADAAGNEGADGTANELEVDTVPPSITVDTLITTDITPPLTGTVDDPAAVIAISVAGTDYMATNNGDGTWTLADNTVNALSDGVYDVLATATDPLGNAGTDPTDGELNVDTNGPAVTVDVLVTNDTTPALTGTVSEQDASLTVTVDGSDYAAMNNGDGTWTVADNLIDPPLAEGDYNVAIVATDALGNMGTDNTADELRIDTTSPVVTVTPALAATASPALSGTVDDPTAAISVTVDGATYTASNIGNGTWSLVAGQIADLATGIYDVAVTATDPAGNSDADDTADELEVDLDVPEVTVDELTTNDNTPALTGSIDDPSATVQITVGGQTNMAVNNGDGTWTLPDNTLTPLPDGAYNVTAVATDPAGNTSTDPTLVDDLFVITFAPEVTVTPLTTSDTTPQLNGTVNQTTSAVQVTVDGQTADAINNGDGTWSLPDNTLAPLAEGTYDVDVRATDLLGNEGTDTTADELTIDLTVPSITVDELASRDRTPPLTGTVSDPEVPINVTVDGQTVQATNNGDGTWTLADNALTPLNNGTYNVVAEAGGATDMTISELTVDTIGPSVLVSGPSVSMTKSGPVSFNVHYDDAAFVALLLSDLETFAILDANPTVLAAGGTKVAKTFPITTATADGVLSISGTGNEVRTVTVSDLTGDGYLGIGVIAGSALDSVGNPAGSATSQTLVFVDNSAPAVSSLGVVDQAIADVRFDEPMSEFALDPENYTLSGPGLGTLAPTPDNVAQVEPNRFRLTWNAGSMLNGEDLTVTVLNVTDQVENLIGEDNHATTVVEGIGVSPFVAEVNVLEARSASVRFSEPIATGALDVLNYTISGPGQGTLPDNPTSISELPINDPDDPDVLLLDQRNTYLLTWTEGEMLQGGDVTITVAGVEDNSGNSLVSPMSGTDPGGGIGIPPVLASVNVLTGLTVEVRFDEAMGPSAQDPANYSISNEGQGTLTAQPDSVSQTGPGIYVLTWNTGEMLNGGDVTITVNGVSDASGNAIDGQNSATDVNGGRDGLISVTIPARRDTTLYEDAAGALANGAGATMFAGTGDGGLIRRGLLQFDVAGNIPEGSIIEDATLELFSPGTAGDATSRTLGIHLVGSGWSEGDTDAGEPGADGAPVVAGDATWVHRTFDTETWTTPGGDFVAAARATTAVAGTGAYSWTSAEAIADVQGWLDDPDNNFGWLLAGVETGANTVKAFRTDEHDMVAERPVLEVVFSLNGGPGEPTLGTIGDQVVNEGEALTLDLTANDVGGNDLAISSALANLPSGHNAVLTDNGDGTAQFSWTPAFTDAGSYVVTFIVTQTGVANPLSISESVKIDVANVNQAPVLDAFAPATATEGEPFIVTASATDSDATDSLTFSLVAPFEGASIDPVSGLFSWTPGFSSAGDYSIGIRVRDNGSPALSDTETLSIAVADANGPPAIEPVGDQVVVEAEVLAFRVMATDPDQDDTLTFSLESAPAGATINAETGQFQWTPSIVAAGEHTVTVVVTDDGEPAMFASDTFQISVLDDNRDPTAIALSPARVGENMPAGTTVGTLITEDPDTADVHTYTLVDGDGDTHNSLFTVAGNELRTAASFDFESRSSYSIRLSSFDGKDGVVSMALTVSVLNQNDPPTAINLNNTTVAENEPAGTLVGRFITSDQDSADNHQYSLVSGAGDSSNSRFAIAGDTLVTSGSLDFEVQNSHSVRVRSEDSSGDFVEASFTVTVTNTNDLPAGVSLSDTQVAENAPAGTEVGRFMTSDEDGGSSPTYTLVSGDGSQNNGQFRIVDDALQVRQPLDFEAGRMRSIRVRTVDDQLSPFEMVFAIEVLDRNDAPTDIGISAAGILGNVPADTVVGDLFTQDQDVDDSHTYALVPGEGDSNNNRFKIVGLQLVTNGRVNFDSNATFNIRIRSTDAAGARVEEAFELVNDDVDGDGLSDTWELEHFGNLLLGADDDPDGDGLTNLEEFMAGSNPNRMDSDGDGVGDADEVALGSDPASSNDTPAVLAVSPESVSTGRDEDMVSLRVRNTGLESLTWTAEIISGNFAEIVSGRTGSNTGDISVTLAANPTSSSRTATIRITASGAVGSPVEIPLSQSACSAPGVPNDVLATNGTLPGQVRVLWDSVADADQYEVYRSLETDPSAADLIATVVGTAFTDTTAAVLPDTKQTEDTGGGCIPVVDPEPEPSASAYQYWVRAVNVCGRSAFSTPNDGFPGSGQPPAMALFESVLPAVEAESRALRARVDSVLAIRLRRDTAIEPDSIQGEVVRSTGTDTAVTWRAIDTEGLKDGWAIYDPGDGLFELGETVTFTVRANTVSGESIGPLTFDFTVESEAEFLDRIGAGAAPIAQPAYADFDATGIDLSREGQDEVDVYAVGESFTPGGLNNTTGPAYAIVPDEVYGQPQRVWLPLADNMRASDVSVNYYFVDKTGNRTGWYEASRIVGWADDTSFLELELDGTRYIGFTVQHGALVRMAMAPAKQASVSAAGPLPAALVRVGGDGIITLLLIIALVVVMPRVMRPRKARALD